MNRPNVSNDFTISDIHKIREFNAVERNRVGKKEYNTELNKRVAAFLNIDVDEMKKKNSIIINKKI